MTEFQQHEYAGVGTASLSSDIESLSDSDPYTIHGIALAPGDITHGRSGDTKLWTEEGLKAAAETLSGKPLVKNHINSTEGKVGEVTKAEFVPGVGVVYEAEIAPHYKQLAQDVAAGLMEVSVRALHPETKALEQRDDGVYVIRRMVFDNLSLVNTGASPSNTVQTGGHPEFNEAVSMAASPEGAASNWTTATLSRPAGLEDPDEFVSETETDEEPVETDTVEELDEPADLDVEDTDDTESASLSLPVATVQRRPDNREPTAGSGRAQLKHATSIMNEITYETADEEELEALSDPVVVETEELEALRDDAESAETVEAELSELRDDLGELDDARDTLAELSEEHVEALQDADDPVVIESEELEAKEELVDETGAIYAEELSDHSPFSAEELQEKFSPAELAERVDESEEASIAEELSETEPEPEGGSVDDGDLEGDTEAEELEAKTEAFANTLEQNGWETQAEELRSGELELDEVQA